MNATFPEPEPVPPAHARLLRAKEVMARLGIKKTAFYRMIQQGSFPPPAEITPRFKVWPEDEIDDWIIRRVRQRQTVN